VEAPKKGGQDVVILWVVVVVRPIAVAGRDRNIAQAVLLPEGLHIEMPAILATA
jgi:hypothetical protein